PFLAQYEISNAINFVILKCRTGRQHQTLIENTPGHAPAGHTTSLKYRLLVHWLPKRARFNVFFRQLFLHLLPTDTKAIPINKNAGKPAIGAAPVRFILEFNALAAGEPLPVSVEYSPS